MARLGVSPSKRKHNDGREKNVQLCLKKKDKREKAILSLSLSMYIYITYGFSSTTTGVGRVMQSAGCGQPDRSTTTQQQRKNEYFLTP